MSEQDNDDPQHQVVGTSPIPDYDPDTDLFTGPTSPTYNPASESFDHDE